MSSIWSKLKREAHYCYTFCNSTFGCHSVNAWKHTCNLSDWNVLSQILSWFALYPWCLWQAQFSGQNLWRAFPSSLLIYVFAAKTRPLYLKFSAEKNLNSYSVLLLQLHSSLMKSCRVCIFLVFYGSNIPGTKDENRNKTPKSLQAPNSLVIISFHKIWDFYFFVFWDFLLPSLILQTSVFQCQVDRNKLE